MSDHYVDVVTKLRDKSQKQIDKLERDYQDTGSASTYRTINKHYDIVKTCDLALEALDGKCHFCERCKRLLDDLIKRYKTLQETGNTIDIKKVIHDLIDIRY